MNDESKGKINDEFVGLKSMVRYIIFNVFRFSLSGFDDKTYNDDKRYILDDEINTLTYFHKDVRSQ